MSAAELWSRLREGAWVEGEQPVDTQMPWSIRIMLGLGAWLASLLALGFLAVMLQGMLQETGVRTVLGLIAGGVAYHLAPQAQARPFAGQIGLVLAALGQLLLFWSLFDVLHGQFALGLALVLLAAASLLIPTYIWRMWNTALLLLGVGALLGATGLPLVLAWMLGLAAAGCIWAWMHPQRWIAQHALIAPMATALGLSTLLLTAWNPLFGWVAGLVFELSRDRELDRLALACSVVLSCSNGALVWMLMARLDLDVGKRVAAIGLVLLWAVATWSTPACSAALGLLLLGYGRHLHFLACCGAIGIAMGLSAHYYSLSWPLNAKALGLLSIGLLLLAVRALLLRTKAST